MGLLSVHVQRHLRADVHAAKGAAPSSARASSGAAPGVSFGIAATLLIVYVGALHLAKPFLVASAPGTIVAGLLASGVYVLSLTVCPLGARS